MYVLEYVYTIIHNTSVLWIAHTPRVVPVVHNAIHTIIPLASSNTSYEYIPNIIYTTLAGVVASMDTLLEY